MTAQTGPGAILLAAGGTGGHLFPALALAAELKKHDYEIHLATDERAEHLQAEVAVDAVHIVPSDTIRSRSPLRLARTATTLARGTFAAWRLIGGLQPRLVAGFGGYPSLPTIWAAHFRKTPICLHEQNGVLGRANKALAKYATAVALSLPSTKFVDEVIEAKATITGNPVRPAVVEARIVPYRAPLLDDEFRLLVFGGSQGAQFISDTIPPAIFQLPEDLRSRLKIVQQCRVEDVERVEQAYRQAGIAAEVAAFFTDLPARMADAHLVVSRSGASTAAELAVIGRPAIMVPLPHAIDNDQLANAEALALAGAGWLLPQAEITPQRLAQEISTCMTNPDALAKAAANALKAGRPDAAANLAALVMAIIQDTD